MKVLSVNNITFKKTSETEAVKKGKAGNNDTLMYITLGAVVASTALILHRTNKIVKKDINTPNVNRLLESSSLVIDIENFNNNPKIKSIDDLSGLENVKKFFDQYLTLSENPGVAKEHNIETFSSILFWGVPGTGKTSAAKGIAKKLNADYIQIDKEFFDSMFVSEGPKKLAEILNQIEKHAKKYPEKRIVVFMDEIDGTISNDIGISARHGDDLINTLKRGMTYLQEECENIIFIGATNKDPNAIKSDNSTLKLNPAILSRFKYQMEIDLPNKEAIYDAWSKLMNKQGGGNKFTTTQNKMISEKFHELGMSFRDITLIADKLNREDAVEFCNKKSYNSCRNLIDILKKDEKIGYDPVNKKCMDANKKSAIISSIERILNS